MESKYSKYTLSELTVEYFNYEKKIKDTMILKNELDDKINNLYNDRKDIYNLIRDKQDKEDEIRKQNYIKYGYNVKSDNVELNRNYDLSLSDLKNFY